MFTFRVEYDIPPMRGICTTSIEANSEEDVVNQLAENEETRQYRIRKIEQITNMKEQ